MTMTTNNNTALADDEDFVLYPQSMETRLTSFGRAIFALFPQIFLAVERNCIYTAAATAVLLLLLLY